MYHSIIGLLDTRQSNLSNKTTLSLSVRASFITVQDKSVTCWLEAGLRLKPPRCALKMEWPIRCLSPWYFYFLNNGLIYTDFLGGTIVKNLPAYAGDTRDNLWIRKIPWNRKWQPVPLFLPGEFHEQRRLTSYSPWGLKESNTTEQRHTHIHDLCSETAAAKSHLSCPTLCDPIVGSPPGFPVPGILQARILKLPFPPPGDLPDLGIKPRDQTRVFSIVDRCSTV